MLVYNIIFITSKFEVLCTFREKKRCYQKIIINSVLNDISSMYLAGVCTVGAFVLCSLNT